MTEPNLQENKETTGQNRSFTDYYELLQLSPHADSEMIERVYRLLAQRFHPSNKKTGDQKAFGEVLAAYRTLKDPEKRAAYDAEYENQQKLKWKVFDSAHAAQGKRAAKEVRRALVSVLYTKRMNDLDNPGMTIREVETLTGVPREHLFAAAWYLREKGLIEVSGQGRYAITAQGMDFCEEWDEVEAAPQTSSSTPEPEKPRNEASTERSEIRTPQGQPGTHSEPGHPDPARPNATQPGSTAPAETVCAGPREIQASPGANGASTPQQGTQAAALVKPKAIDGADGQVMRSLRKLSMSTLSPLPVSPAEVVRPGRVELRPRAVFSFAGKKS